MMEYEQKDSDDQDGPPLTQHGAMDAVLKGPHFWRASATDNSKSGGARGGQPVVIATRKVRVQQNKGGPDERVRRGQVAVVAHAVLSLAL